MGDPGCGKTIFCHQFIKESLKEGQLCIYTAIDNFPDDVRGSIEGLGVDIKLYEHMGKFIFIDCYSSQIGLEAKERLYVDSCNLSELSISLSKALAQQESLGKAVLVLDSFPTLIHKCGLQSSLEFLRTLIAKTRIFESVCLIKMNRQAFNSEILSNVQEMVECVIEMKSEERSNRLYHYLRITKTKRHNHNTTWTPYIVLSDRGLVETKEEI